VGSYAVVFVVALVTTLVATPLARRLSLRVGALVPPGERRVHTEPLPTLGGVALLAGFVVAFGVASRLSGLHAVFSASSAPLGIVVAAVVIFAVGELDDLRKVGLAGGDGGGVSAPAKMAGMVLAGSILSIAGVSTIFLRVPFGGILALTPDLAALVTVLWVVGMANALNFIDGLDGLCAGIVAIAAGSFFLYGHRLEHVGVLRPGNVGPLVAVIVLGICLGFLPYNFHPAKIIMGDSGALLLGLLMAASTMSVGGSTDAEFSGQTFFFFAPLFIPLFILGVPVLDTAFAIVRRASQRSGVTGADKEHLHHRLMQMGHGQRRSVLILWAWTAILSTLVLYPTYTGRGDAIVPLAAAALGLVLYIFFHPGARRTRAAADGAADGEPADDGGVRTDLPSAAVDLDADTSTAEERPAVHADGPAAPTEVGSTSVP
jgi:UDP-GlcNAc:undecaprenyl-phosphate GlcNAc-1-phosphate transferase